MARIRTIKPDFWTDEKVVELAYDARLFFIGTWNFADDYGNLQRSAKKLKMQIFPADAIDVEPLIDSLITHGLLSEYSVSGEKYLHINGFSEHQVVNRRSKSKIPSPLGVGFEGVEGDLFATVTEYSVTEGKGSEVDALHADSLSVPAVEKIFSHWQTVMDAPRAACDAKRKKLILAALEIGYTAADLCKAIDGCRASPWHMGENERGRQYKSLALILRDAEKIDAFMAMADNPPQRAAPPRETLTDQRARAFAELTGRAHGANLDPFTVDGHAKRID